MSRPLLALASPSLQGPKLSSGILVRVRATCMRKSSKHCTKKLARKAGGGAGKNTSSRRGHRLPVI